jgi:chemotaxis protein MotA
LLLVHAGLLIVIGSVVAGYLIERGNLLVLMQPAELLIIAGGALGIILTSSPARNLRNLIKAVFSIHKQRSYTRDSYLEALKVLYVLFQLGRGAGRLALENQVETPEESEVFLAHPSLLADSEATAFICDSFRMALSAGLSAEEVARLMALDIDVQRSSRLQPLRTLTNVADSLPGLGIIAAVLGVVVTMQALGGPAVDIGQRVAAALVGTFLGILACYGVISPICGHLDCISRARSEFLQVLRVTIASFFNGATPMVAAEAGRRSIPLDLRPSLEEMQYELRHEKIPLSPAQQEAMAAAGMTPQSE